MTSLMLSDDEELITEHSAPSAGMVDLEKGAGAGSSREERQKLLGGDDDDDLEEDFFLTGPRVGTALATDDRSGRM